MAPLRCLIGSVRRELPEPEIHTLGDFPVCLCVCVFRKVTQTGPEPGESENRSGTGRPGVMRRAARPTGLTEAWRDGEDVESRGGQRPKGAGLERVDDACGSSLEDESPWFRWLILF